MCLQIKIVKINIFYFLISEIGMMMRSIISATKPDIVIENDGNNYSVTTVTSLKTIKISFTLGQQYEADPGTDKKSKVLISVQIKSIKKFNLFSIIVQLTLLFSCRFPVSVRVLCSIVVNFIYLMEQVHSSQCLS